MAFKNYWDNKHGDIIRSDVMGNWTWQDYDRSVIELSQMLATVEHRVYFIADWRHSGRVPHNPYSSQHIKRGREIRPANYGLTVNVGADIVTRITFSVGTKILKKFTPSQFVDTVDEAYEIIEKERQRASKIVSDDTEVSQKHTPDEKDQ